MKKIKQKQLRRMIKEIIAENRYSVGPPHSGAEPWGNYPKGEGSAWNRPNLEDIVDNAIIMHFDLENENKGGAETMRLLRDEAGVAGDLEFVKIVDEYGDEMAELWDEKMAGEGNPFRR